jgi:hypothetical protein
MSRIASFATIPLACAVGYELRGLVEGQSFNWGFLLSSAIAAMTTYVVAFAQIQERRA